MRLKVLLPTHVLVDQDVVKVVAEAQNGAFCLLPRHVDFVAALTEGLLAYTDAHGRETFLAVDGGVLVKCESEVLVSTPNGVLGPDLGKLRQMIEESFQKLDEHECMARTALARLEADFVRRFIELN
jgi:F-type H+-transporting ATPase subunit epsilon